jgi:hypothetical protein
MELPPTEKNGNHRFYGITLKNGGKWKLEKNEN